MAKKKRARRCRRHRSTKTLPRHITLKAARRKWQCVTFKPKGRRPCRMACTEWHGRKRRGRK